MKISEMKKTSPSHKKKSALLATVTSFLKTHWLAIILVAIGTWLRIVDLPNNAIVFPDAGRDLLEAVTAIKNHEFPLLGIPSSIPRFKQGPLSIWLNMSIYSAVGYKMETYSLVYAFIGILAIIGIYETCIVFFNQRVGLIALALLSFSPLAIAHSRMAYHTTPIPIFTIFYWWGLQALLQNKKHGVFWAVLTGWLLFQFELSLFPVLLAIPIVLYLKKTTFLKCWKDCLFGTLLGLLPQIIFDLTHKFAQLGGFAVWMGYRIISLILPGQHTISSHKLSQFWTSVSTYIPRIWGVDVNWVNVLLLLLFVLGFIQVYRIWKQTKNQSFGLLLLLFFLITLGYFVHGSPSEAYYPIYLILLPLITAAGLESLGKKQFLVSLCVVLIVGTANYQTVIRHSFFVSNTQEMSYGPSNSELQQIASVLQAANRPKITIGLGGGTTQFPSSFDNIKWAAAQNHQKQPKMELMLEPTTPEIAEVLYLPNKLVQSSAQKNSRQIKFASQTLLWQKTPNARN